MTILAKKHLTKVCACDFCFKCRISCVIHLLKKRKLTQCIDDHPRKRGRPPKAVRVSESPVTQAHQTPTTQTPKSAQHAPSHASPPQASPSKSTPTKTPVLKALPTVRDHTSNELNEEGDEYLPRETDDAGEKKVLPNGAPLGGRQYKCRTFFMPNRGQKLFMLATECAKVLNYRDSYLLFNKNRSLYKIIANQAEKNELIHQDILPSSYRSRQIAIVTARSMYRQFGSRLIVNGRRVRDDYWESKARKQGFTEDDPAGEKRPGAAKAREAAAAAAEASNAAALAAIPQGPIIYSSTGAGQMSHAQHGLPMIQPIPEHDLGDYSSVSRPRHEITGTAYQDKTQPAGAAEIMSQAAQTAEFNQTLGRQRANRANFLEDIWRQPHEPASSQTQPLEGNVSTSVSQAQRSPQQPSSGISAPPQGLGSHTPQSRHSMMAPSGYSQPALHHGLIAQSPNRPAPQQLPGGSIHHRSPTMPMGVAGSYGQAQYGYPQPMWTSSQAQPSSLVQAPMQYGGAMQQPSPHMPSNTMHPAQLHSASNAGMPGMGYNAVPGGMNPPGYAAVPRQMYQQPGQQGSQHYIQQSSTQPTTQGMQNWHNQAPSHGQHSGQQPWQQNF